MRQRATMNNREKPNPRNHKAAATTTGAAVKPKDCKEKTNGKNYWKAKMRADNFAGEMTWR